MSLRAGHFLCLKAYNPMTSSAETLPIRGTRAWVFAGQGSQVPGMGEDIYKAFPQTQRIFESAAAGFDLKELCFNASAELLGDTRYTQASMAAFAAAVVMVLRDNGIDCDAALGLSLGEYNALFAADVLESETLLELLGFRGAIMADASSFPSTMTAVFGLEDEVVEETVREARELAGKGVFCTNYNCPGQLVIGGEADTVLVAEELLKARGARRCIALKTSGPFHTPFMAEAATKLAERLAPLSFKAQRVPVIFNVTASPAPDSEIKDLLIAQMVSPVRFAQSIQTLESAGIKTIVEIGPGHVLAGLIKKTSPGMSVVSIETAEDLRKVIEA